MLGVASVALLVVRWGGKLAAAATTVALIVLGLWTFDFAIRTGSLNVRQGEYKYAGGCAHGARLRSEEGSVVLAGQHSGSMRYYSGRITLRADGLDNEWLDRAVDVAYRARPPCLRAPRGGRGPAFRG